tara:strand:- start:1665 stop:2072 length:408 start_codon:yes stop_codon:yes gene_type:complete
MGQVFIMVFGVLLLVTILVAFSDLKDDTVEYSANPQFEAVGQHVHAIIISAVEHMNTADSGYIPVVIPRQIAGKSYILRVNSTHIRVEDFDQVMNQTILLSQGNVTITGNISSDDSGKARAFFNTSARTITFTVQ